MMDIRPPRTDQVLDPLRVRRYRQAPERGPRLLFFSGGSALEGISRRLQRYSHNTIHLVTPFDSGGSSATLRDAFGMPALGDLRSRLMALADETVPGHSQVHRLFTHRLPKEAGSDTLRATLDALASGHHPLIDDISNPMRRLICHRLGVFRAAMPDDFDLRGASIGNLILAGGYLDGRRQLDPLVRRVSELVHVRGTVRAVVGDDYHLAATLADGRRVLGQHRITGKEVPPLDTPIARVDLSASGEAHVPVTAALPEENRRLIASADLICYPPGSFYSSVLANLLPAGVGRAIRDTPCPKVFIPNPGHDPEQVGRDLPGLVTTLVETLRRDTGEACPASALLDVILIDSRHGDYVGHLDADFLAELGVTLIDTPLVSERSAPHFDEDLLVAALLSLA
ncbi:GAK system CofD-like protein [Halomonas stenophila]|uniref:CofD-related protein of GAK system n=1 Tax=Halomonas stenophila TaxID=795312 RepID=A0A7W5EUX6_9GAMM|nr:GAK system CofD-like protein [Halomonas stenophila]MBB3231899.1 CofD-related protein of GAK system [Halomonas stenophila]